MFLYFAGLRAPSVRYSSACQLLYCGSSCFRVRFVSVCLNGGPIRPPFRLRVLFNSIQFNRCVHCTALHMRPSHSGVASAGDAPNPRFVSWTTADLTFERCK